MSSDRSQPPPRPPAPQSAERPSHVRRRPVALRRPEQAARASLIRSMSELLRRAAHALATDVFATVGRPPMASIDGELRPLEGTNLDELRIESLIASIGLDEDEVAAWRSGRDLDLLHVDAPGARFRMNLYRQRGQPAFVARRIPDDRPTIDGLGLPPVLKEVALLERGLVFVCGATASGKSTTLAAMIEHRNRSRSGHIVTVEDPIEFSHPHQRSIISQRELGVDVQTYADALRSALRQSPQVVMIGEVRDFATAEALVHVAETGHLVLTTLHAGTVAQALERFVGLFPEARREALGAFLGLDLAMVVAQRLLRARPTADGGPSGRAARVAAFEVLPATPRARELVSQMRWGELDDYLSEHSGEGDVLCFDDDLFRLVTGGWVDEEVAMSHATRPANLRLRLESTRDASHDGFELR